MPASRRATWCGSVLGSSNGTPRRGGSSLNARATSPRRAASASVRRAASASTRRGRSLGPAILGGTFDPIHYAHLAIAEQTRDLLGLSEVLFLPAATPPHKDASGVSAAHHRAAMVDLAIADHPAFALSRLELDRPGTSYLVETLEAFVAGRPDMDPIFILSAEALAELPRWREPRRIVEAARVAVVPRRGHPRPTDRWLSEHFAGLEDRFLFLDGPDLGHSSSEIRRLVAAGRSVRYLVPRDVEAYIERHGLYRTPDETPAPDPARPTEPTRPTIGHDDTRRLTTR